MLPVSRNIFLPICSPSLPCFHIFSAKDQQKYPDIIANYLPYLRAPHAPNCSRQLGKPPTDPFIPPQNQTIHRSRNSKSRNQRQDSSRHYRTHKWQHQQIQQHRIDRNLIEKPQLYGQCKQDDSHAGGKTSFDRRHHTLNSFIRHLSPAFPVLVSRIGGITQNICHSPKPYRPYRYLLAF